MTAEGRARSAELWRDMRLAAAGIDGDIDYEPFLYDGDDPDGCGAALTALAADGWRLLGPLHLSELRGEPVFIGTLYRTMPPEVVR